MFGREHDLARITSTELGRDGEGSVFLIAAQSLVRARKQ